MSEKTKLQIKREEAGLTVEKLAKKVFQNRYTMSGSLGHIRLTIEYIESKGNVAWKKPRKTYEYKDLARVLNCNVDEIMED